MRIIGLEPTRLAAPDPKSGMSTNFTISAKFVSANIVIIMSQAKIIFIILMCASMVFQIQHKKFNFNQINNFSIER